MSRSSGSPASAGAWWRLVVLVATAAAAIPLLVMLLARNERRVETTRSAKAPPAAVPTPTDPPEAPELVGSSRCRECHEKQFEGWRGSHHELAMQPATEQSVRGDFDGASFRHRGQTTTFSKRDGRFFVRTPGADGRLAEFEVKYTFGFEPLQQYLIPFEDGRMQVLTLAWDTQGRRWFYQHPGLTEAQEKILHWTGRYQNWNHMCAECHSTGLEKRYDVQAKRYRTGWKEISVGCEACHGPGSNHLLWAERKKQGGTPPNWRHTGLPLRLAPPDEVSWLMDPKTGMAKRSKPRSERLEVELCARCHARRAPLAEGYQHGKPLMNTHHPELLDPLLYHPDGQIDDEVFVYGSFLQSKMYQAGVTCSDCHDSHTLAIRGAVDQVCARCHLSDTFAAPAHHFHKPESPGARCIGCHMPKKRYMVVDPRGDHSFRVPRPDLSLTLGTPNACNNSGCHADKSPRWSAEAVTKWYGGRVEQRPHYGTTLHAARRGDPAVFSALARLTAATDQAAIVRASATSLLRNYPGFPVEAVVRPALQDAEPLVRRAAITVTEPLPPRRRAALLAPLLTDPLLDVRLEAARLLAGPPESELDVEQRRALTRASAEYVRVQQVNADRGESHTNLALLALRRGKLAAARHAYQTALRVDPQFMAAYVNLADLYRQQERDDLGAKVLKRALALQPDNADAHHALGLLRTRQKRSREAIEAFERALELQPDSPQYAYVYAVALNSSGKTTEALEALERALAANPFAQQLLYALATINRDAGRHSKAAAFAQRLAQVAPRAPAVRALIEQLRR